MKRAQPLVRTPTATGDVWERIYSLLQPKGGISTHALHTWFKALRLVADQGELIVVEADELRRHWIEKHFPAALHAATVAVRPGAHVTFVEPAFRSEQPRDAPASGSVREVRKGAR
jgi:chromosomal replication initiation ATPase DnaA